MKKYKVSIWFKQVDVIVSAKNKVDARKKSYDKLSKIPASRKIDTKETVVED